MGAQLERAEGELEERKKEIAILREQLFKSQQENYRLIQQLQR